MSQTEWSAKAYEDGAYIQSTIATPYLDLLQLKSTDKVLDIGCGDGEFSLKMIKKLSHGQFTGIDISNNMLQLAREKTAHFKHVTFEQRDVLEMQYERQFNYIVSFWCLHWARDIQQACERMYSALVPGGKLMALLPTGHDSLIDVYLMVRDSGHFPQLDQLIRTLNYANLQNIEHDMSALPFKHSSVQRIKRAIILPSLDTFRRFIKGINFCDAKLSIHLIDDINEAFVDAYDQICKQNYQGVHRFESSIFLVTAER